MASSEEFEVRYVADADFSDLSAAAAKAQAEIAAIQRKERVENDKAIAAAKKRARADSDAADVRKAAALENVKNQGLEQRAILDTAKAIGKADREETATRNKRRRKIADENRADKRAAAKRIADNEQLELASSRRVTEKKINDATSVETHKAKLLASEDSKARDRDRAAEQRREAAADADLGRIRNVGKAEDVAYREAVSRLRAEYKLAEGFNNDRIRNLNLLHGQAISIDRDNAKSQERAARTTYAYHAARIQQLAAERRANEQVRKDLKDDDGHYRVTGRLVDDLKKKFTSLSGGGSGGGIDGASRSLRRFDGGSRGAINSVTRLRSAVGGLLIISTVASAIAPIVALLGSLSGAALGAANALASLSSISFTIGPGLAALATGIGAGVAALSGIGGAFKAKTASNKASAKGAAKAAGGGGGGGGGSGPSAQEQLDKVAQAERRYQVAIRSVTRAQQDLNDAREQAIQDLEDLQDAVSKGPGNEQEALADLQKAKEAYQRLLADPGSTQGDLLGGQADITQAEERLADVRKENVRNQKDLNEAQAKGVDGADNVVRAQEDLADAIYESQQAQKDLNDAMNPDGADSGGGGGGGYDAADAALDAYEAALAKLSPSARKFVETLVSMQGAWQALQRSVQERFFSRFVDDLGLAVGFLPTLSLLLGQSADALGQIAEKALKLVTSGPFTEDFATIAYRNNNLLRTFGEIALDLLDVFRNLTIVAGPFTQELANSLADATERFKDLVQSARDTGRLAQWLDTAKDRTYDWFEIIGNTGQALFNLGAASSEMGDRVLDSLKRVTQGWQDVTEAQREDGSGLRTYFEDIRPLLFSTAELLRAIGSAFTDMASDKRNIAAATDLLDELRTKVLPSLVNLLERLGQSGVLHNILDLFASLLDTFAALSEAGDTFISAFAQVLKTFSELLKAISSIPGATVIIGGLTFALGALAAIRFIGALTGLTAFVTYLRRQIGLTNAATAANARLASSYNGVALASSRAAAAGSGGVRLKGAAATRAASAASVAVPAVTGTAAAGTGLKALSARFAALAASAGPAAVAILAVGTALYSGYQIFKNWDAITAQASKSFGDLKGSLSAFLRGDDKEGFQKLWSALNFTADFTASLNQVLEIERKAMAEALPEAAKKLASALRGLDLSGTFTDVQASIGDTTDKVRELFDEANARDGKAAPGAKTTKIKLSGGAEISEINGNKIALQDYNRVLAENEGNADKAYAAMLKYAAQLPVYRKALTESEEKQKRFDEGLENITNNFGITADAAGKFAAFMGVSAESFYNGTKSASELWAAVRDGKAAYDAATPAAQDLMDTFYDFSSSAQTAGDKVKFFSDMLNKTLDIKTSFADSLYNAAEALDQLKSSMEGVNFTTALLDDGSINFADKGGRVLYQALKDAGQAARDASNDAYELAVQQGRGTTAAKEAADAYANSLAKSLEEVARATGQPIEEITRLNALYGLTPEQVRTLIETPGSAEAKKILDDLGVKIGDLNLTPVNVPVATPNTGPAEDALTRLARDRVARVLIEAGAPGSEFNIPYADGGIAKFAKGGITKLTNNNSKVKNFARGSEKHIATIARPGSTRIWNEPETQGEGYVPLAVSKRPRSEKIMSVLGDLMGGKYVSSAGVADNPWLKGLGSGLAGDRMPSIAVPQPMFRDGGNGTPSVNTVSMDKSVNLGGVTIVTPNPREAGASIARTVRSLSHLTGGSSN